VEKTEESVKDEGIEIATGKETKREPRVTKIKKVLPGRGASIATDSSGGLNNPREKQQLGLMERGGLEKKMLESRNDGKKGHSQIGHQSFEELIRG